MSRLHDLARDYEQRHFPPARRLDLHGEGPGAARGRALRFIQMWAHEAPGTELLLIVARGRGASPVRHEVESLLAGLQGKLLDWWGQWGPGSLAVRIALQPNLFARTAPPAPKHDEGRTAQTSRPGLPDATEDIPRELLPLAERAAELRRTREGFPPATARVLLQGIWIEAQAIAMTEALDWRAALRRVLADEERRAREQ